MKHSVIIISDGGHEMGMGHIMRCLSLAKALRDEKIDVIFYCGEDTACKKIESERFNVIRAGNIDKATDDEKPKVLFIDLPPHINRSCYIDSAKKRGIISIAFDDMLINGEKADVIINPSIVSRQSSAIGHQPDYSGAEYAVINDSFLPPLNPLLCKEGKGEVKAKKIGKNAGNILITMGGSDPAGQTERILKALLDLNLRLNIEVVIGMAYKEKSGVGSPGHPSSGWVAGVRIHKDARNMAELMEKADMAFVAGGITLYEAASVGLPVIIIAQDKYQALTAGEFQKKGFGIYLGMFNEVSEDLIRRKCRGLLDDHNKRKKMSGIGKKLVDGKGVFRVAEIIKAELNRTQIFTDTHRYYLTQRCKD